MEFKETNLYAGVKKYFEAQGFTVRAEVKDIDVCALKDDLLIGIELKRNLTVDLLVQGALRQKVCDLVYVVVPKPKRIKKNRSFNNMLQLLRRLELGLIYVDLDKAEAIEVLAPAFFNMDKARKTLLSRRLGLLAEIKGRSLNLNEGGSSKVKLMTSYREEALKAVALLEIKEVAAPKDLKIIGLKSSIFRDNYYGWFKNIARGTYVLDIDKSLEYGKYREYIIIFQKELQL